MSERIENTNERGAEQNGDLYAELCAFVLGELDGPEAARIEAALADSAELREKRDEIAATIGLVRSACGGGESLSPQILGAIGRAARPAPAPRAWHASTSLRMAASLVALAGGVIWGRSLLTGPTAPGDPLDVAVASIEEEIEREGARLRGSSTFKLAEDGLHLADKSHAGARGEGLERVPLSDTGVNSQTVEAFEDQIQDLEAEERKLLGKDVLDSLGAPDSTVERGSAPVDPRVRYQGRVGPNPPSGAGGGGSLDAVVVQDRNGFGTSTGNPVLDQGAIDFYGAKREDETGVVLHLQDGASEWHRWQPPATGGRDATRTNGVGDRRSGGGGGGALGLDQGLAAGKRYEPVGGGTYVGPGDSVPPGKPSADPSTGYYFDSGGAASGEDVRGRPENLYRLRLEDQPKEIAKGAAHELARRARKESDEKLVQLPGNAGGPASPGPSGATAPPPGTPATATRGGLALGAEVVLGEELKALGYADDEGDASDDFFLGGERVAFDKLGQDHARVPVRRQLTPAEFDELCRHRVDRILQDCRRRPHEPPSMMFFRFWGDNAFELAQLDNQSTFGVDVDTASYALARRYLSEGHLPEKAQIRTEEFVNYFKPDVPAPLESTFAIHTDLAPSRFGGVQGTQSQRWMMRVVVRGKEVSATERKPLNLTFVVDCSGSMKENDRIELVKHGLRLLTTQLDANDSIAIVAFSNEARLVLPMTSMANRGVVEAAIFGLQPDGSTNAEAGLKLGYEIATAALSAGVTNRVVLLSDGVANVGQTDQDRINGDVQRNRDLGIYLNTIGVGLGNHNDVFLEQLANKGDGLCNYIDSAIEARRALVENFTSAFEPIARDVKIQVEFDKAQVYRYRLLGYENRAIADQDFRNDAIDAGEIGAGHQVVALYELETTGTQSTEPLATVRLRWKQPIGVGRDPLEDTATEIAHSLPFSSATSWEGASGAYKRSAMGAQFAEILRRSVHARYDSLDELIAEATKLAPALADPDFTEFVALLQKSRELILRSIPRSDDLTLCIDAIRRNRILRAQYDELRRTENRAVIEELERQNAQLEARIRELIQDELQQKIR